MNENSKQILNHVDGLCYQGLRKALKFLYVLFFYLFVFNNFLFDCTFGHDLSYLPRFFHQRFRALHFGPAQRNHRNSINSGIRSHCNHDSQLVLCCRQLVTRQLDLWKLEKRIFNIFRPPFDKNNLQLSPKLCLLV